MQLKWPMLWDLFSLFPAYAGVIPARTCAPSLSEPFPRIRGGDPRTRYRFRVLTGFSPHTRG